MSLFTNHGRFVTDLVTVSITRSDSNVILFLGVSLMGYKSCDFFPIAMSDPDLVVNWYLSPVTVKDNPAVASFPIETRLYGDSGTYFVSFRVKLYVLPFVFSNK